MFVFLINLISILLEVYFIVIIVIGERKVELVEVEIGKILLIFWKGIDNWCWDWEFGDERENESEWGGGRGERKDLRGGNWVVLYFNFLNWILVF